MKVTVLISVSFPSPSPRDNGWYLLFAVLREKKNGATENEAGSSRTKKATNPSGGRYHDYRYHG